MRAVYLRVLTNTVLPRISEEYLARTVEGCPLGAIAVRGRERRLLVRIRLSPAMAPNIRAHHSAGKGRARARRASVSRHARYRGARTTVGVRPFDRIAQSQHREGLSLAMSETLRRQRGRSTRRIGSTPAGSTCCNGTGRCPGCGFRRARRVTSASCRGRGWCSCVSALSSRIGFTPPWRSTRSTTSSVSPTPGNVTSS
jgi:hypothetical protein